MISKNILNTRFDPSKRSKVYFDASLFAVCGILTQDRAVVSCASKTLNKAQKKLLTIERELFAFAFSCKKFRIQLHGNHFEAVTDHKPLVGLTKKLDNHDAMNNCYVLTFRHLSTPIPCLIYPVRKIYLLITGQDVNILGAYS